MASTDTVSDVDTTPVTVPLAVASTVSVDAEHDTAREVDENPLATTASVVKNKDGSAAAHAPESAVIKPAVGGLPAEEPNEIKTPAVPTWQPLSAAATASQQDAVIVCCLQTELVRSKAERKITSEELLKQRHATIVAGGPKIQSSALPPPADVATAAVMDDLWTEMKSQAEQGVCLPFKKFLGLLHMDGQRVRPLFKELVDLCFRQPSSRMVDVAAFVAAIDRRVHALVQTVVEQAFSHHDSNKDNHLDQDETANAIKMAAQSSELRLEDEQQDAMIKAVFAELDTDRSQTISLDEVAAVVHKDDETYELIRSAVLAQLRLHALMKVPRPSIFLPIRRFFYSFDAFFYQCVALLLANGALIGWVFKTRWDQGASWPVLVARCCGMCLNLNCALILLPVMRRILTTVRQTAFGLYLGIDKAVDFHRLIGYLIFLQAVAHTAAHITNYELTTTKYATWEYIFTARADQGWFYGIAGLTGFLLLLVFVVMFICALPFVRRSGHFEVFYWTHRLYVVFLVLLVAHAPRFWFFLGIPAFLWIIEVMCRTVDSLLHSATEAIQLEALPSSVTKLVIKRPQLFDFRAGEYVLLRIPSVARFEWHPFTISSAPERDGVITLHVRKLGNWTTKLHELAKTLPAIGSADASARTLTGVGPMDAQSSSSSTLTLLPTQTDRSLVGTADASKDESKEAAVSSVASTDKIIVELSALKSASGELVTAGPSDVPTAGSIASPRSSTARKPALAHLESRVASSVPCDVLGPFGAPASAIFHVEHAVLIAAGIGVTPFASILESVWFRHQLTVLQCPACHQTWSTLDQLKQNEEMRHRPTASKGNSRKTIQRTTSAFNKSGKAHHTHVMQQARSPLGNLKKVSFLWVNRDQASFEWFVQLLAMLEDDMASFEQFAAFLELQVYMTGVRSKSDPRSLLLHLALELYARHTGRDAITGLRTRTQAGRPNWDRILTDLVAAKHGRVTVFFCGPNAVAEVIGDACARLKIGFRKENF